MTTKGQLFWNAYGNLQAGIESETGYDFNRELLTYIQADERYVSYVDEYLETATDLTEPKGDIRARAVAEHETASRTLDTSPGYSTDVQGLANDFYYVIEQSYPDTQATATVEAAPETPAETATDPITQRIDDAFAAVEEATVPMPELERYTQGTEPVYTAMGDIAVPGTPAAEIITAETPTTADPAVVAGSEPVVTAMGDVVIPGSSDEATVTAEAPVTTDPTTTAAVSPDTAEPAPVEQTYDEDFARTQLGGLAETPEAEIVPVTESIKPEDMPVPIVQEVQPVETEHTASTDQNNIAAPEEQSTTNDYTVRRGDNLWKIAREYYDLENDRDIQRAVDHIATVNGMTQGTDANHIQIGQVLQLPDSPVPPASTQPLNWQALDAETKGNLRGTFRSAVNNEQPEAEVTRTAGLEVRGMTATLG